MNGIQYREEAENFDLLKGEICIMHGINQGWWSCQSNHDRCQELRFVFKYAFKEGCLKDDNVCMHNC